MGRAKHEMMRQDDIENLALGIAIESGVIKECDFHPGIYLEGSMHLEEAYKLANYKISCGAIKGVERMELTDAIKLVVERDISQSCYYCDKLEQE